MREIKFRVWDTYRNKMIKWDELHSDSNYLCLMVFDGNGYRTRAMQYTGLKDKNGREIYEGDIVTGLFNHTDIIGHIIYGSDATFFIKRKGLYGIGLNNAEDWLEVVGNIYENPELLKEWNYE